jgi:hypothetical protein
MATITTHPISNQEELFTSYGHKYWLQVLNCRNKTTILHKRRTNLELNIITPDITVEQNKLSGDLIESIQRVAENYQIESDELKMSFGGL